MLYAAIDIHKHAFQAAVLDPEGGEVVEARFSADRESLARWAEEWRGRVAAVAIEATTGWRWVWRELVCAWLRGAAGRAGAGSRAARPPAQREDRPARRALAGAAAGEGDAARVVDPAGGDPAAARPDATAQGAGRGPPPLGAAAARLPAARGLAVREVAAADAGGDALGGDAEAARARRLQVDSLLAVIGALEEQLDPVEGELRRFARRRALPGAGVDLRGRPDPRLPPARRDRRGPPLPPRQPVPRASGLDPSVTNRPRAAAAAASPGRLAAPALGAGRGRPTTANRRTPRPRALRRRCRPARRHGR